MEIKQQLFAAVDALAPKLTGMADFIFDNPELCFEEIQATRLLTDYLEQQGFVVERGIGTVDTAFRAVYQKGAGGPSIGLLCEYDALKRLGHACAHHIQGPAIVGAAQAIKETIGDKPYRLVVYGTPAEEGGGGKIIMMANGCFRDIDVALMTHGGPATQVDVKSMAMISANVTFHGKSAHAALKPESGRSALDALLLSFQGIEFLREHVREDARMHYTVLDAGGPANVTPARAVGEFALRSYNSAYLDEMIARFEKIIEGASLMTGTTYQIAIQKRLESKIPAYLLNELLMENARLLDAPQLRPAREKTGSTDFGNITYEIPGACIRIGFVPEGTPSHSQEFLDAGKTQAGHAATVYAAKILAATVWDLIRQPELVEQIKGEFDEIKISMRR